MKQTKAQSLSNIREFKEELDSYIKNLSYRSYVFAKSPVKLKAIRQEMLSLDKVRQDFYAQYGDIKSI